MPDTTTTVTLRYESFDIEWQRHDDDGTPYTSTWTNYGSRDEAEAVIDRADDDGIVIRKSWTVEVSADDPLLPTMRRNAVDEY